MIILSVCFKTGSIKTFRISGVEWTAGHLTSMSLNFCKNNYPVEAVICSYHRGVCEDSKRLKCHLTTLGQYVPKTPSNILQHLKV